MSDLEEIWSFISSLVVVDALVIAVVFGAVLLFAFTVGRERLLTAYFATAVAGLTTLLMPSLGFIPYVNILPEQQQDLILFGLVFIMAMLIFWSNRFFDPYIVPSGIEKIVFSIGLAGWLVVLLGTIASPELLGVSGPVELYFFTPGAKIVWLLAPLGGFLVFRGKV